MALLAGDDLIGRYEEPGRGHAAQILGMVDAVLAEAGVTLSMLDGIAASVGPGAFTGVRISVAVAQGLAFGAGLAVAAVTTLEALALQAFDGGADHALVCLDARMGEVYWGCFAVDDSRGVRATTAPQVGAAAAVRLHPAGTRPGHYRGIGRGFAAYPMLADLPGLVVDPRASAALPNSREMARLGAIKLRAGEGVDPADLAPLYLRDKVALTEAERAAK